MSYTVEQLVSVNPYNPDILPDLENYVKDQVSSQTYSLDANLCLLRLSQFEPERMSTSHFGQGSYGNACPRFQPLSLFNSRKSANGRTVQDSNVLSHYLETIRFRQFWDEAAKSRQIVEVVPGFEQAIQDYAIHVLSLTYQKVPRSILAEIVLSCHDLVASIHRSNYLLRHHYFMHHHPDMDVLGSARWIGNHGFSIGIDDVQPGGHLNDNERAKILEGYESCDKLIHEYNEGMLKLQPGCDSVQTLEAEITVVLNNIRETTAKGCAEELHWRNSPLIMSQCGSKGSLINIGQMIACVGQQIVGGRRALNGFIDRSLPHFPRKSKTPSVYSVII